MTFRRDLVRILSVQPRSVSSIARELGLDRRDVEEDLRHAILISPHSRQRLANVKPKALPLGFDQRAERAGDLWDQMREVQSPTVEIEPAGLHA